MGNIQTLRKLALKMVTSGTATVEENTKLYKGCYAYVWLQVYVPLTQNRSDDTAPLCTVHGIITDTLGNTRHLGAKRYNMKLVEQRTIDGQDFVLFERKMPKPLTDAIGDLKLVFNYSEITTDGKLSSRLASSVYSTTVEEGDESDDEIDVDLKSQEAAQINKNTLDIQLLQADAEELRDEVSAKVDEQDGKIDEALAAAGRAEDVAGIAMSTASTALSTAQGIDAKAQQAINTANTAKNTAERVENETAAKLQTQDEALDDLRATKADKTAVYTIGQTDAAINAAIEALIGAAPDELNTLQEIVEYLQTHGDVLDSLLIEIATKASTSDLEALRTDVMSRLQEAVDAAENSEYYSQQASASASASQQAATNAVQYASEANSNSETAINTADRAEQKIDMAIATMEEILQDAGLMASDMREILITEGGAIWWTGSEAPYELFIPKQRHLLGDRVIAFTQPSLDGATVEDFYESPRYNNGDITITSSIKWEGRILVAGGLREMQDTNARADLATEIERAQVAEATLAASVTSLQDGKVDKVTGKSLIADTEIARLASVTNQTLAGLEGARASDLSAEIAARGQADNALQEQINKKASSTELATETTQRVQAVQDLNNAIGTLDSKVDTGLSNLESKIDTDIANVIGNAPENLNTLREIADYITGHGAEAAELTASIAANAQNIGQLQAEATAKWIILNNTEAGLNNKVDKVSGKGLSSEDYTSAEKTKLAGIAAGAEVNVQPDWSQANSGADDYIKNKPTSMPASDVSAWAKATSKPTYTKSEVGLGNVDNTSDLNKPISTATQGALDNKADLGADGKVLSSQLPSYVDDVMEFANKAAFPATGEAGKIYVDLATNLTWRWSGSAYVEISASLALGETSSTAYRGDRGKTAYEHSQTSGNPHGTTPTDIGAEPAFTKNSAFNKAFGTGSGSVCEGNDSRLTNARPASDVSAWAKAATKPSYTYSEISGTPKSYASTGQGVDGYMTQKAVTDALNDLQAGAFTPYIVAAAWAGSVGNYSFTVSATAHGKGTTPHVTTKMSGSVIDCEPYIDAAGNITIYSNANLSITMEVR